MVSAQLSGARSLRDLERVLERHPGVLAHLGLGRVARATLADANATRPAALFEAVAAKLCTDFAGGRTGKEALRLIDATRIFAGKRVEAWARGGIKLHLSLDPHEERPVWFAVTGERVNDITPVKASMPIEAGHSYVFDKGYYDFSFWAKLHAARCRFVTRLKQNSPTRVLRERRARGEGILFDRIVMLSQRLSANRRNPFQAPARVIGIKLDTGREITLLTNDLKAPAAEIAALYKARWQVELFFKWIKQNLKLAHFLGTSENAVTVQILAALIAYLLMRLASLKHKANLGLQAFARLMPNVLFARRPLAHIFAAPQPPPDGLDPKRQIEFAYA
jgi:IS4 transposase